MGMQPIMPTIPPYTPNLANYGNNAGGNGMYGSPMVNAMAAPTQSVDYNAGSYPGNSGYGANTAGYGYGSNTNYSQPTVPAWNTSSTMGAGAAYGYNGNMNYNQAAMGNMGNPSGFNYTKTAAPTGMVGAGTGYGNLNTGWGANETNVNYTPTAGYGNDAFNMSMNAPIAPAPNWSMPTATMPTPQYQQTDTFNSMAANPMVAAPAGPGALGGNAGASGGEMDLNALMQMLAQEEAANAGKNGGSQGTPQDLMAALQPGAAAGGSLGLDTSKYAPAPGGGYMELGQGSSSSGLFSWKGLAILAAVAGGAFYFRKHIPGLGKKEVEAKAPQAMTDIAESAKKEIGEAYEAIEGFIGKLGDKKLFNDSKTKAEAAIKQVKEKVDIADIKEKEKLIQNLENNHTSIIKAVEGVEDNAAEAIQASVKAEVGNYRKQSNETLEGLIAILKATT